MITSAKVRILFTNNIMSTPKKKTKLKAMEEHKFIQSKYEILHLLQLK
jgi:hypothetical protein